MAYLSNWPHVKGGRGSRCSTVVYTHGGRGECGVWKVVLVVVVVVVVVTAVTVVVAVARTAVAHRRRPLSHGWWPYPACQRAVSDWLNGCWLQFKLVSGRI